MTRRWLVTGCSTGLGRALVEELAASGERVVATARKPDVLAELAAGYPENVVVTALDVRDPQACAAAVELARERFGGLDVLVNNAGFGQFGTVEEISDSELREQFETNFFGPWRLVREVLPLWREQGGGHAVFVSSIAAVVPLPGLSAYCASKAALDSLADALAVDAAAFGVKSTSLQLGGFVTSYGVSLREPERAIEAYAPVSGETLTGTRGMVDNEELSRPDMFAKLVRRVVEEPSPQRVPFGAGVDEYLVPVMTARYDEFTKALAEGRHLP